MAYKLFKHNGKILRGNEGLLGYEPHGLPFPVFIFNAPEAFSISVATPGWDGTMEYSTDAKTWNVWDGSEVSGTRVYLRGSNNTKVTGQSSADYAWTLSGSDIVCTGNIETLLDYETVASGEHPEMAESCYQYMFYNCTNLTTAPDLPATTLADSCYYYMFYGCTSLTTAPKLPATTLADSCYCYMFYGCTSLTTAPDLPATTLASYCYSSMFRGCTSLTTAPKLPATTLADNCYFYMFYDCTNLTTAPELPATTLASWCYSSMFRGCKSLTTAPELPATKLASYCYKCMFYGCTSLKLSATQTDEYTQEYRIPTSGEGTTATNALASMFDSTGGTFTGTPEINTTYYLHKDCSIV